MKLNNKGFAITAVIYGLLILFAYFVSFYLLALSAKKNTLDNIIKDIEGETPEVTPGETLNGTLAQYISNLYNSASKVTVTNNSIVYNYATSANLMNDRLGGETSDYNGGNIRYYGESPNNYIYFKCNDYNNQSSSTCEVWRIIGVFDGKVKIIRNERLDDDFAWDSGGNNDWSNASLNTYLNGEYYSGMNDTTKSIITETTWNIGGYNTNVSGGIYEGTTKYSNDSYIDEIKTTWSGHIALMSNSDYGYATDFLSCELNLYGYADSVCYNNDWLYLGTTQWTLTNNNSSSEYVWQVYRSFGGGSYGADCSMLYAIRPTLYLEADTLYVDGDGSSDNPYQIKPNN